MQYIFQTRKINNRKIKNNLSSQTDFASDCVNANKFGLKSILCL